MPPKVAMPTPMPRRGVATFNELMSACCIVENRSAGVWMEVFIQMLSWDGTHCMVLRIGSIKTDYTREEMMWQLRYFFTAIAWHVATRRPSVSDADGPPASSSSAA